MRLVGPGCILAVAVVAAPAEAQAPAPDSARTTRSGVYSEPQMELGRDLYAMNCASCHTAVTHTGPAFVAKWRGRPLWDLFRYVSELMPKSQPGSLTQREYGRVLAYILKMNGLPAGPADLPADSTVLKHVIIEFKTAGDTTKR